MQRKIYLHMQSRTEAQELFWSRCASIVLEPETIASSKALGRVTAEPVFAHFSSPSFHSAAMDGLAVRAEDTFTASDAQPLTLRLDTGEALAINTGYPMPPDTNAVIMIEQVLLNEEGSQAVIRAPVYPWQHVRKVGEDIVATELLFPSGHQIRPADIGALLSGGCRSIAVRRQPKVAIVPSGSELVQLDEHPHAVPPGAIIESNASVLAAMAQQAGAVTEICPIVRDEYAIIKAELSRLVAGTADIILVNAGSSSGSADYTVRVIEELGEVLVHGVTIMPGKPTILGIINQKPVLGIPGYPVSAIIAMEQFVVPLLLRMQGIAPLPQPQVQARLARDLPSKGGIEEYTRVIVGQIEDAFVAVPLKKGAGAISTLTRANGMLRIDAASEGEKQGSIVNIDLLVPQQQVERSLLCIGSHDLCLDLINDFLRKGNPAYFLASTHVGSLGGIMALQQGMCHIAGSHLLDERDGSYNITFLRRYLPDRDMRLVTLVYREQGFIVAKGNPKNIKGVQDLVAPGIRFINRQAGSGTRVLLDYELAKKGIDADMIEGYSQDEYTHMAVAVAVLSGKADTGLGIQAAARALGLDFVPLVEERYDLIIPGALMATPMIQALLESIHSSAFQTQVEAMGGYSTRETGRLVAMECAK